MAKKQPKAGEQADETGMSQIMKSLMSHVGFSPSNNGKSLWSVNSTDKSDLYFRKPKRKKGVHLKLQHESLRKMTGAKMAGEIEITRLTGINRW